MFPFSNGKEWLFCYGNTSMNIIFLIKSDGSCMINIPYTTTIIGDDIKCQMNTISGTRHFATITALKTTKYALYKFPSGVVESYTKEIIDATAGEIIIQDTGIDGYSLGAAYFISVDN